MSEISIKEVDCYNWIDSREGWKNAVTPYFFIDDFTSLAG